MSQHSNIIGPGFHFMTKNILQFLKYTFSTFHRIKSITFIKIPRHSSLHTKVRNYISKLELNRGNIK